MYNKRAQTGFIGEYFIYSELIKNNKNCFITLGNAKSVDLIIIDNKKKAHFVDVKSTRTEMKNLHKHATYRDEMGKLGRWQLHVSNFWNTHKNNPNRISYDFADYYIFHNVNKPQQNTILSGKELVNVIHRRIDNYLVQNKVSELKKEHICNWEFCDLCFSETLNYNEWSKLP